MEDTNFDPLWLYNPQADYTYEQISSGRRYGKSEVSEIIKNAMESTVVGPYSWQTTSPAPSYDQVKALHRAQFIGGIPPEPTKEKPIMGYAKSNQELIDDAVREQIEAPRRALEIAKRVALVKALEPLADAEVGTVITYVRTLDKKDHLYAAIKVSDTKWYATGEGVVSNGQSYTWNDLLLLLTTGNSAASNVQRAVTFEAPGSAA